MNAAAIIERMAAFPAVVRAALGGVSDDEARYAAEPGKWSIVEIVCHLADEEVQDFRTRLRLTLESPETDWPPIDPEGWAKQRGYASADLGEALGRFERERGASIGWLRSVAGADWGTTHTHPKFGSMRAGDLLGAWAAHDALHMRQIAKRLFELASRDAAGYSVRYAGEWGA